MTATKTLTRRRALQGIAGIPVAVAAGAGSRPSMAAPEGARYLVEVRNTGTRKGDEVVQVYVRDRVASVTRPVRRLKGFRRVTLGPGASTIAEIELPPRAFSLWNMRMEEAIEPGVIDIGVGPDSVNLNCAELRIV